MKNKRVLIMSLILFVLVFIFLNMIMSYFFSVSLFSVAITGKVVDSGVINIYVQEIANLIAIHLPENVTYNSDSYTCSGEGYPKCDDYRYILPMNVSANFIVDPVGGWNFSLYDLRHDVYIENNTEFSPNTTVNAVRWGNLLSISAQEEDAYWTTQNVVFTVEVPNSAPILGNISDTIFVCEKQILNEKFNATDVDEDILSDFVSPPNPFYTDYLGKDGHTNNMFSIISGTLGKEDVGEYPETISVLDPYGQSDSKEVEIEVIEINNPPVLQNIGAQTVWMSGTDSTFYYEARVSDVEDGRSSDGDMLFSLSWGHDENLFDINNTFGIMNYSPSEGHQGSSSLTYLLTVCVEDDPLETVHENISVCSPRDGDSETVCDSFTLTVTEENRAPEIITYYPNESLTILGTGVITFNVSVTDDDGTVPDIDWYVDGALKEHNENVSNDNYSYSFGCGVSGNHNVEIITTDGLLNDSQTWEIGVTLIDCPVQESSSGGGGGGGGAIVGFNLTEKWVCDDWGVCQNAKRSFEAGVLSPEDYYSTKELCVQNNYDDRFCGFQLTTCRDINFANNSIFRIPPPPEIQVCYFTEDPSCEDGITNCHDGACELLVDCGGPCLSCASCSDKIQNQGEFGIDCGGPCPYACAAEEPFGGIVFILVLIIFVILAIIFIIVKIVNIFRYRIFLAGKRRGPND